MLPICKKWGSRCVLSLLCILFIPFEKNKCLTESFHVATELRFVLFLHAVLGRLISYNRITSVWSERVVSSVSSDMDWRLTVSFLFVLFHPPQHQFSKGFAFAASPGEIKSSFRCITSISIAHAQFLNVCPTARLSLHLRFNRHYASSVSGQWGHKMHRIRFKERHQIWKSRLLCLDYLSGQISWSSQLISNSHESHSLP